MGIAPILRTIVLALAFSCLQISGAKNHPRRRPRAKLPSRVATNYEVSRNLLSGGAECAIPLPPEIQAPKTNVWNRLSRREGEEVSKWLMKQEELNLKNYTNYIGEIQLMPPNKTNVLQYFDHDGKKPDRYASVLLEYVTTKDPEFRYVLVGPLPISNATTWEWLDYPFTSTEGRIRNLFAGGDYRKYNQFHKNITDSVKDITENLWNLTGRHHPTSYSCQDPVWQYNDRVTEWSQYWGQSRGVFDDDDLLPLGLYYKAEYDLFLRDPSSWKFGGWLYNDIYYPTTEEFRSAYFSPGFEKLGANIPGEWTQTDQRGTVLPLDREAPPMPVAKRPRFSVDYRQEYVEWMGFSFYLSFDFDTGMTLHDIRFKGERILYELGLQEALAHYAGNDPVQSGTAYLDSAYGLGYPGELMAGYDCPTYSTFLNITFSGGYSDTVVNALCLFEFDADYSIQRHYYESNTKNIYFVVRTISTVGNYDYMFSYEFYLDGSIQVVVRAAGYIQSAYYAKNHDYGYHIHDYLSGSMHDHVLNFKADFDILGTSNTMELVTVTPVTGNYIWSDQPRNTMKLVRHEVESEDESRLMWSGNSDTQYRIVNTEKPNKYGEYRGYRILPSQGTIHLAARNSSNLVNAANWAYNDLAVTKQKDSEPRSANANNGENVYEPLVNFDDFFDGESLKQEDVVVWFNLGMHHIPHTGDLPNTVFTTAHSAVQITPSNYFDYDQSRDTVNMVRLNYDYHNHHYNVITFGQAPQICMANLSKVD